MVLSPSVVQKVFCNIIKQCMEIHLIGGEEMVDDSSYIPANVSRNS